MPIPSIQLQPAGDLIPARDRRSVVCAAMQVPEFMSMILPAVGVSTLIVLAAWALVRFAWEMRRTPADEPFAEGAGESFDATSVAFRIQQVRLDYSSNLGKLPHAEAQRKRRVQAARFAVAQCSYFQHVHTDLHPREAVPAMT